MIKRLGKAVRGIMSVLCLFLLLLLFFQVVNRYLLKISWSSLQFLITFSLVWLSILGAAYGVHARSHFVVNFFIESVGVSSHTAIRFASASFVLLGLILIGTGWDFMELGMTKRDPSTELPMVFTYAALPVGGILIVIFGLEHTFSSASKMNHEVDKKL